MPYHKEADPQDVELVRSALSDASRAVAWHAERESRAKDARALLLLDGSRRNVSVAVMADAAGVSEAQVRAEMARARKTLEPPAVAS